MKAWLIGIVELDVDEESGTAEGSSEAWQTMDEAVAFTLRRMVEGLRVEKMGEEILPPQPVDQMRSMGWPGSVRVMYEEP